MSWKSLAPFRGLRNDEQTNHISITARDLLVRLDQRLLDQLQWAVGDLVDVMPGTGEHHGLLRVERHEKGWRLSYPGGGKRKLNGCCFKIRRALAPDDFPGMPERMRPHPLAVQLVDGGIVMRLPWVEAAVPDAAQAIVVGPGEPLGAPKKAEPDPLQISAIEEVDAAEPAAVSQAAAQTPAVQPSAKVAKRKRAAAEAVETAEDAIARGFPVTVCPPAMPARHGNPLNAKAHPLSGGRVHG